MKKYRGTLMGFDFGKRRIGVAVGQTVTMTSAPVTTIIAIDGEPQWYEVKKVIDTWKPKLIVVGVPTHMNGQDSDMTLPARRFAQSLHTKYGIEVIEADERLTSVEAATFDPQAKHSDARAAAIILESWMSDHKHQLD